MKRKDTVKVDGMIVGEHRSLCDLGHRHHTVARPTENGVLVELRCELGRTPLQTFALARSGQLTVDSVPAPLEVRADKPLYDGAYKVLELHRQMGSACADDGLTWPCRTVRALTGVEATEDPTTARVRPLVAEWRQTAIDKEARADTVADQKYGDDLRVEADMLKRCADALERTLDEQV